MKFSTTNNFDLIRLFAASQVAITHAAEHTGYESTWIDWLDLFPGVPIFFFVSGFLIYGSYEKSLDGDHPLKNFFIKRFLRLYPALWLCVFVSIALVWSSGYLASVDFTWLQFGTWVFTSSTFFQFFNPEFLRGFGVGAINGSLWTISVELQFYILTPLLYPLLRRGAHVAVPLVLVFCVLNGLHTQFNPKETVVEKLIGVSFVPWLYMFLLGALAYQHKRVFEAVTRAPLTLIAGLFVLSWYVSSVLELGWGNDINVIGYIAMVALVIKLATTNPGLADRTLHRNDISYGVYIFHMPIVNFLLETVGGGYRAWGLAMLATVGMALFSWFLVERPSLRLKTRQLRAN